MKNSYVAAVESKLTHKQACGLVTTQESSRTLWLGNKNLLSNLGVRVAETLRESVVACIVLNPLHF